MVIFHSFLYVYQRVPVKPMENPNKNRSQARLAKKLGLRTQRGLMPLAEQFHPGGQ